MLRLGGAEGGALAAAAEAGVAPLRAGGAPFLVAVLATKVSSVEAPRGFSVHAHVRARARARGS